MNYKLSLLLVLLLVNLVGLTRPAFTANDLQKLKVAYSSLTGAYSPLWIAVEGRLGRKHGLDLECVYIGRIVRPHQVLISGAAQYVASTGTGIVASHAAGMKDLVIIASFADTTGSSIFAGPAVKITADLKGKVVGVGRPGGISDTLLSYILKRRLRLDPVQDAKVLRLGDDPSILPALEQGKVDAALLSTPARLIARQRGFREIADLDELGIRFPYVGVSTLKATLKQEPEMTRRLIRTLIDGIRVFKTNKADSLLAMKRYLRGANNDVLAESYRYFAGVIQEFPYPAPQTIKAALDMMSDQYPGAGNVDPLEVVDLSFVREVEQSAVLP